MTAAPTGRAALPSVLRCAVRCVHGLEPFAAAELSGTRAAGLRLDRRLVLADLPGPDLPGLLGLKVADDVLLLAGQVAGASGGRPVESVAGMLGDLDWTPVLAAVRSVRPLPERLGLDVVAAVAGVRRWSRFAVEQAAGPVLARRFGARYLERGPHGRVEGRADLSIRLDVTPDRVTAALRLGPAPLHRRPWKLDTGPGTLHPPVAAALAVAAGLGPDRAPLELLDPFCGDGTVVVEAALAAGRAAGRTVRGSDTDPQRVANARANATRAGVTAGLEVADALDVPGPVDLLLSNPPWNLAVDAAGRLGGRLTPFWRRLPELLAPGGVAWLLAEAELDAPAALGRVGLAVGPVRRLRVAGRVVDLVGAGREVAPALPQAVAGWTDRAIDAGVLAPGGW